MKKEKDFRSQAPKYITTEMSIFYYLWSTDFVEKESFFFLKEDRRRMYHAGS